MNKISAVCCLIGVVASLLIGNILAAIWAFACLLNTVAFILRDAEND